MARRKIKAVQIGELWKSIFGDETYFVLGKDSRRRVWLLQLDGNGGGCVYRTMTDDAGLYKELYPLYVQLI